MTKQQKAINQAIIEALAKYGDYTEARLAIQLIIKAYQNNK